ncbi:hypothetical protein FNV58_01370 (plasmid) [Streptomyces sp. RLB1-9]|uniref:ParB/RepB/Spo0J family partition protein n=1 Tax=Streptomyces sp. RLB1-9 TaxID=2594454 RepID=UPI00116397AB|nr:ParB/RepB/Spo0J family partition protein [Streptomyces sp. RLB1-9]QDN95012.1 hypothetical protein FNV58_01370 [Streptomyces sp. RLB1-9]
MLKFATAQIIAASLGDQQRVTKAAHRAVFEYDARPGYLYVRSRAISSRCNDNFDEFPAEEIAASYKTFVGKPVFVNHVNDNHRRARGVIIDAALHHDRNPDGSPDTWAEVLMEIDATRFPKLAKAILAGHIDRTSMGCDVERSVCSACGNEARTPADYCSHIPHLKGKRIFRATAGGKKVGELVRETCFGLRFFENSVLVEPPADPTAHFLGVDASGLGKAASKSRVHVGSEPWIDTTAATDYSQFEDHDGLEGDDDGGEDEAPQPKPAHPAAHAKPAVPHVPFEGTTPDHQRRQDAVTHAKPFTPLKPSLNGLQAQAAQGLSWDDIGARHPHIYGDPEVHGEAAEHADGQMIGWAANDLAHSTRDDPDAERHDISELTFHRAMVDPHTIDHKRHGSSDGRVASAVEGYKKNPDEMPPVVLVHRHGVFQVADGHHRTEAAKAVGMDKVPAYVAKSPYPNKPSGWGERAPYHGAEKTRWTPPKTKETPAPAAPQWEQQKLFEARRQAALQAMAAAKKPAPKAAEPEVDEYGTPKPKRGQPYEPAGDHPWYKQVPLHHDHIVDHWDKATDEEKDSGMRWYSDAHHVAKAIAKLHPGITSDEEAAHKGAGVLSAYSPRTNWPMNMFNAAHSFHRQAAVRPLKDDPDKPAHAITMGMHADKAQRIMDGEHHQPVLNSPKTQDFAHLIEHGGHEPQTDEEKKSGAEPRMSGRVVVDRHALSVAAGRRITDVENDAHSGFPGTGGKHARHYYEHAANTYRNAAAAISEKEGKPVGAHQVQAVTWLVRQRLNADEDQANVNANAKNLGTGRRKSEENIKGHWKDFAGEHAPELKEQGNSHVARVIDSTSINDDGTIRAVAYGEIKAPADVDTLREENCPVCGDKDTFDGIQCQICGFINPPEQFRDPDLDKAKQLDLRKQIVDPQLIDNNGELQRVNDDGTGMPQDGEEPGDEEQQLGPDGQPLDEGDPQMVDADQLDENGLPPSPFGDQALDGTQQAGPAVSDRNGDGMIQPDEIDPDGNVNAQPQMVDPGQGGQAAPRELPGWGKDHTGLPFWPGPDMPDHPGEPDSPDDKLGLDDDAPHGRMPEPMMGQPGDGVPDLFCPSCGFGADATAPQTQDMGNPGGAADGVVDGDVCPSCQRAQLLTPGEINSNFSKAPAVERSPWS